jgi:5-methylcytosine-specific restriction protein A
MARSGYYRSPHWKALRRAALERDGHRCIVPGCQTPTHELTVDHKKRRPPYAEGSTPMDVLHNLRTLCGNHDRQVKELPSGERRNGGALRVDGCGADGRPIDPAHPWNRTR